MAFRKILRQEDPALYKVSRPVVKFDERLFTLLDDLKDTMYNADGVGLAACQVGVLRRALVIDVDDELIEMINPEIVSTSGEQGDTEGCLSFPGQAGYVIRPMNVTARAQNRHGVWVDYEAQGMLARAILHEVDHLDGKVFLRLVQEPPDDEGLQIKEEEK